MSFYKCMFTPPELVFFFFVIYAMILSTTLNSRKSLWKLYLRGERIPLISGRFLSSNDPLI